MGKYEKLKKESQNIVSDIKNEASHFQDISDEYSRVASSYSASSIILNNIDRDFSRATRLNKVDIGFLFFATALQCVRQYVLPNLTEFKTKDERPNDKEAANKAGKKEGEYQERTHRWYNPSLNEIIANPVPFDAICQTDNVKGALKGGGKLGHRLTMGHDPILGWVVGTANIATSTLTRWDGMSFHVKTGNIQRGSKITSQDFLTNPAKNEKIFEYTNNKVFNQGIEGKTIIGTSIIKEAQHLLSDVTSKNSLPFPIVATISPDLANTLADYGIDACNIIRAGEQAAYASLINFFVAMIHRLTYDETHFSSQTMHEVKTRKILSYSNLIASASNLIAVAVTEAIAVSTGDVELAKKGKKYFDIGGLMVTIYRLISDSNFIKNVQMEFMENQWYDMIVGSDYDFMKENVK